MSNESVKMLTTSEVADRLNVHPNTVRQWCRQGRLKAYRLGSRGDRRFKTTDIDSLLMVEISQETVVLIVDDDDEVRTLLCDIVTDNGCRAIEAASGEQALEQLEQHIFDLIFVDLMLPGLNGVEILSKIKSMDRKPIITVITGHGDTSIAKKAECMGPTFFIRKPFDTNDISSILDLTMRLRR
jgi:excisionase family DNA binding protein